MASPNVSAGEREVIELEKRAEQQRHRLSRDVGTLRQSVREELDVRSRMENGIHDRPRAFYGAAAGIALFMGYVLARLLKA